jgi:hypothetical protein
MSSQPVSLLLDLPFLLLILMYDIGETHASYSWLSAACPLPSKEISAWIKANIPGHTIEADSQDGLPEDTPWNDCLDFHSASSPDGQADQDAETLSPSPKKKKPLITYRARKSSTTSRNSASTSAAAGRKPLKLAPILQFRDFLEEQATQASQRALSPPPPLPAAQRMRKDDVQAANPKKRPTRSKAAISEIGRPSKRLAAASEKGKERETENKLQPAELLQMHARTRLMGIVSGIIHDQGADSTSSTTARPSKRMHAHPVPFPVQPQAPTRPVRRLTRAGRQSALDRNSEGDTQVIDPATFLLQEESTEIIEDFSSAAIVVQDDHNSNNDDTDMEVAHALLAADKSAFEEDIDDSRQISSHNNPFNDHQLPLDTPVASTSKLPSPQTVGPAPPLSSSITSTSFTSASSSLNFQYVPFSITAVHSRSAQHSQAPEAVLQSTGLAPPPDPVSNQSLDAPDGSNMDIDTSAVSATKSVENHMPQAAQPRRSPRQKEQKAVKATLFARKSTKPADVSKSTRSKGKDREVSSERDAISMASFLRLVFEPPSEQRPTKRLKAAEGRSDLSRPSIPKYIPFRTLSSSVPLAPILHTYVDSKDLYTGGIFGSGYLGLGRRGHWILPLTAFQNSLLSEGKDRASQGTVLGLDDSSDAVGSHNSDARGRQIVWTYTRLRVFSDHLRKMAQSSRWGFMDFFPAPLPFSTTSHGAPYCIKISIASSMALMLRSALSEFSCRLHARTKEELEVLADDRDADAGNAGTKWLDGKQGVKLTWWDEIDRREILLA